MTAPVDQTAFGLTQNDPLVVVATLWRGAMVERFARIEFFVNRSLRACVAAHLVTPDDAASTLPRQRCKVLLATLRSTELAGKSGAAIESLTTIIDQWDDRNALCHGRFKMNARAVTLTWTSYDKSGAHENSRVFTPLQMFEALSGLESRARDLGCRLGPVDKLCREIAA